MAETVDQRLIAYYQKAASTGLQFKGLSILSYVDAIGALIKDTDSTRLLDYGCGLGEQYTEHGIHLAWDVPIPRLYDPAVPSHERKPTGRFHGVICSDVMEHIPEPLVDNVLAELFEFAERFVWLSICCRKAKKNFPDGRNLHVTVKPPQWWMDRVTAASKGVRFDLVFTP